MEGIAEHIHENGHEPLSEPDIDALVAEAMDTDEAIEPFDLKRIYDFMAPEYAEESLAQTVLEHLNTLSNVQFAIRGAQKANKAEDVARLTQAQMQSQIVIGAITKRYPATLALAREISSALALNARKQRAALTDEAKRSRLESLDSELAQARRELAAVKAKTGLR